VQLTRVVHYLSCFDVHRDTLNLRPQEPDRPSPRLKWLIGPPLLSLEPAIGHGQEEPSGHASRPRQGVDHEEAQAVRAEGLDPDDFLWPALQAVLALGGSASIAELDAAVIDRENLSPEVQSVLHGDGPMTEVQYRLAWARTYLKGMGLLTNSQRGVWSVTELGETVAEDQIPTLRAEYTASRRKKGPKKKGAKSNLDNEIDQADAEAEADWKDALLDTILSISPHAFERLAQRLLREAGVSSPVVTGRAGDGGIDGRGVYQISLLSFPVFFQCKRYSGSVGPFNAFGLLDPLVELADLLGNAHSRLNADHHFTSFSFRPPETGS
jgi:Mrr N-terminal domain/Restriction endonuclease